MTIIKYLFYRLSYDALDYAYIFSDFEHLRKYIVAQIQKQYEFTIPKTKGSSLEVELTKWINAKKMADVFYEEQIKDHYLCGVWGCIRLLHENEDREYYINGQPTEEQIQKDQKSDSDLLGHMWQGR